jgi:hypothetical protein
MLLATASGIAFGMSSVFTKTVAVDWTGGVSAADVPSLAVIGVLATAGMLLSQAAYRGAGLAAPLATLTVVNPVVAAAVGITMFGETFRYGTTGTALALSCGVVAAGGLILLTTERLTTHARLEPAGAAGPEVAGSEDALLPETVDSLLPEPVGASLPGTVGAPLPETMGAPPVAVGALPRAMGAEVGRGASGDVPVPAVAGAGRGETEAGPDVAYESGERPLSYAACYGIPYVPMPTVERHRTRIRS